MKRKSLLITLMLSLGIAAATQAGFFGDFFKVFKGVTKELAPILPVVGCAVEKLGNIQGGCAVGKVAGKFAGMINAIGDVVIIDLSALPVEDLGRITRPTEVDVTIPTGEGKTLVSFVPTVNDEKGQLAGKKIWFAIYNQKQQPGGMYGNVSMLIFYRHVEGEPKNAWTELGRVPTIKKIETPQNAKIAVDPDGVVSLGDDPINQPLAKLWAAVGEVEKERSIAEPLAR